MNKQPVPEFYFIFLPVMAIIIVLTFFEFRKTYGTKGALLTIGSGAVCAVIIMKILGWW